MKTAVLQPMVAAHALAGVRQIETIMGVDTIRSLDFGKKGPVVRPFSARGTPAKRHKITDRGARKARARAHATWAILHGGTVLNTAPPAPPPPPPAVVETVEPPRPRYEVREHILGDIDVFDTQTQTVVGVYKAVKTANRRARQLNEAA